MNPTAAYTIGTGFSGARFSLTTPPIIPGVSGEGVIYQTDSLRPFGDKHELQSQLDFLRLCHGEERTVDTYYGTAKVKSSQAEAEDTHTADTHKAVVLRDSSGVKLKLTESNIPLGFESTNHRSRQAWLGAELSFTGSERPFTYEQSALVPVNKSTDWLYPDPQAGMGSYSITVGGLYLQAVLKHFMHDVFGFHNISINSAQRSLMQSMVDPTTALFLAQLIAEEIVGHGFQCYKVDAWGSQENSVDTNFCFTDKGELLWKGQHLWKNRGLRNELDPSEEFSIMFYRDHEDMSEKMPPLRVGFLPGSDPKLTFSQNVRFNQFGQEPPVALIGHLFEAGKKWLFGFPM
jgi:hypothetical protein